MRILLIKPGYDAVRLGKKLGPIINTRDTVAYAISWAIKSDENKKGIEA